VEYFILSHPVYDSTRPAQSGHMPTAHPWLRYCSLDISWSHVCLYHGPMPVANIPAWSSLRASVNGDFVVPRTNRRIGDRAFSVVAPCAWNTGLLPTIVREYVFTFFSKSKKNRDFFHFLNCHVKKNFKNVQSLIQVSCIHKSDYRYQTTTKLGTFRNVGFWRTII